MTACYGSIFASTGGYIQREMLGITIFVSGVCCFYLDTGVTQEIWQDDIGLKDSRASTRTVGEKRPLAVNRIDNFDAKVQAEKGFAQKVKGFFLAPQNGEYKFYSSCSGPCDVFIGNLSRDPKQVLKRKIISQKHESRHNEFNRYPDQVSHTIYLEKDKSYFIEAVEKQKGGLGHLSVGVVLPNDKRMFPITKSYLRENDYESHKGKNKRHRPNIKKQRQKIFKKLKEINDFIKDITGDDDGKNSQADTPSVEVESADFGEESGEAPMNNGKPTLDTSGVQFENQDALQPGINIFMDPSKFAGNKTVLSPDKNNALSTNSKTPPVQTVLLSPDSQAPNSAHADELNKDSDNLTKTSHADGLNKDSDNVGKAPNSVMEVVNPEVQKVNGPSKETPIGQLSASMTFGKPDLLEYSNQAKELLTNNNVLTALKAGLSNIIPQLKTSSSSSQAHFQEPLHKSDSTSVADRKQVTEDASITSSTPGMEQLIEPNYSSSPSSLTGDDSNVNGDMFNNEIDSLTNYAKQEIARNGNLSDATISKLVSTIKQKMDTGKHPDDKASVDSNVSYNHNSDGNYDNAVHAATLGAAGNHQERTTDSNNEVQNKDRAEFYDKIVSNIMNEIKKKLINEDKSSFRTDTKGVHNPVESFQERAETKSSTSSQEQMVPQFSQVKELAHTGLTHSYVNPSTLSPGAMQSTKIAVVSSKAVSGQENPQLTHSSSDLNDSNYLQSGAGIASGKTFSNEQLKSTHSTDNVLSSSQSYAFNAGSKDESKFINSHNSADISKAIPSNSVSGILLDTEGSIQEYHDDNIASQNPERKFLLGNRQNLSVISEQRIKENVTIPEYSSIRSNTGSNRKGAMSYQNIQKESKRIFDELQAQNKNYLSELNSKNEIDKLGPSGVSQKSRGPNGNISDRQVPVQTSDGVINRQFPSSTSDQTLAQSPGDTRAETKNVLPSAIEENLHSTPETKMQGYTDQLRQIIKDVVGVKKTGISRKNHIKRHQIKAVSVLKRCRKTI